MKSIPSTVEVSLSNAHDGTPLMTLTAIGKRGREALTSFRTSLEVVRLIALKQKKADIYNVCGSITKGFQLSGEGEETALLTIKMALGGIGLRRDPRLRPTVKKGKK